MLAITLGPMMMMMKNKKQVKLKKNRASTQYVYQHFLLFIKYFQPVLYKR